MERITNFELVQHLAGSENTMYTIRSKYDNKRYNVSPEFFFILMNDGLVNYNSKCKRYYTEEIYKDYILNFGEPLNGLDEMEQINKHYIVGFTVPHHAEYDGLYGGYHESDAVSYTIQNVVSGYMQTIDPRLKREMNILGLLVNMSDYNVEKLRPSLHSLETKDDDTFMDLAMGISTFATCDRLHVGAVIVNEGGYFVSSGYNTAPKGHPTCNEVGHLIYDKSCKRTIHAEMNAIIKGLKTGMNLHTIYVTHQPCNDCAKHIAAVGIRRVVYMHPYPQRYDADLNITFEEYRPKQVVNNG